MSLKAPRDISHTHLITPSVSPPPHVRYTRNNSASPSKRQCTNSVSRSGSRSSVCASDPNFDIQREREASRTRLLDTWSQLAERYSRPMDEDDIVDIRTGEIVKDNGFLRSTRRYQFGEVLAPVDAETGADDEDGIDELDAFSEEHHLLEDIFTRGVQRYPPRAETPDSGDKHDLEDFLKAEQRRREEYGSDFEEEDHETSRASITRTISPALESNNASDNDHESDSEQSVPGDTVSTSSFPVEAEESGSGDELDNWELTEANMIVVSADVRKTLLEEDQSDSASEIELIETLAPTKYPSSPKRRMSIAKPNTPLSSHSSIGQSTSRRINIHLPPQSPSPLPTHKARKASVSPTKTQPSIPESRARGINPRSQTPDVIDITDDEAELGLNRRSSSPSPLPSPCQIHAPVCAGRRTLPAAPKVVISTLPPHAGRVEGLTPSPVLEPSRHSPTKPLKQLVTFEKLSAPEKNTPRRSLPANSSSKKSSQKLRSTQPVEKADKVTKSTKYPSYLRCEPSFSSEEGEEETASVCRPYEPQLQTQINRKRKRASSEHQKIMRGESAEIVPREAMQSKARIAMKDRASSVSPRKSLRYSRSKSRFATPPGNGELSDPDENGRRPAHFASRPATSSLQAPHPPHATPSHSSGLALPPADIRAQQIITSAMQQLATLLWTPSSHSGIDTPMYPHTPTHHRISSVGPSATYSTPHHPHPYPFNYDPSFSRATLPPSSPDPPSSPTKPREGRKSLVSRSHSRGRRVSFYVDQTDESHSDSDSGSAASELRPYQRPHKENYGNARQSSSKGKGAERIISSEIKAAGHVQTEQERKPTRAKPKNVVRPGLESRWSGEEPSTSRSKSSNISSPKRQTKHSKDVGS